MIEYRKASINDIDSLVELRVQFLCEANGVETEIEKNSLLENNKQFFQRQLFNDCFIALVAVVGEEIVATSGLSLYYLPPNKKCPDGRVAYISNMYTNPSYRQKGIASRMFELIIEEAKKRGHKKILLNATDMGRPIYEKFGFSDTRNDMVYYCV